MNNSYVESTKTLLDNPFIPLMADYSSLNVCINIDCDLTSKEQQDFSFSLNSQTLGSWHFANSKICTDSCNEFKLIINAPVTLEPRTFEIVYGRSLNLNNCVFYTDYLWASSTKSQKASEIYLPEWSPERYLGTDYLGPVTFIKTSIKRANSNQMISTRAEVENLIFNGSCSVQHVPLLAYRQTGLPKHEFIETRKDRVANYLKHCQRKTEIRELVGNRLSLLNYGMAPEKISIVIPTHGSSSPNSNLPAVLECLDSIADQELGKSKLQIIIVYDTHGYLEFLEKIKKFEQENIQIETVEFSESFNFSAKCNIGASVADGEVVIFLNDDTTWISRDGIIEMAGTAMLQGVGAVGAKLLFPSGEIQHSGIIVSNGAVGHSYFRTRDSINSFGDSQICHEVIGVTGACFAQRLEVWKLNGGWDEKFASSYNDVDYCFRLHSKGFRILQNNLVSLFHHESMTRESVVNEYEKMLLEIRWADLLTSEKYFRSLVAFNYGMIFSSSGLRRYATRAKSTLKSHGLSGLIKLIMRFIKKRYGSKS